jgi:hypothetical protein
MRPSHRSRGTGAPGVVALVAAYDRSPRTTDDISDHCPDVDSASEQHRRTSSITATNPSPDQRVRGSSPWRRTIFAWSARCCTPGGRDPRDQVTANSLRTRLSPPRTARPAPRRRMCPCAAGGSPLSVAVVVELGHPPEVDLVNRVADDVECVLGHWSRADELVLIEGPSSWQVVVDHLAHLGAQTFLIEICALCCAPARAQPRSHPILDRVPTGGGGPCRSQ